MTESETDQSIETANLNIIPADKPQVPQVQKSMHGDDDIVVIADSPAAMVAAQHALIEKVDQKLVAAREQLAQAEELLEQVVAAGIGDSTAKAIQRRAVSRIEFLQKVREALAAGYVMVPDMPAETIAIRVKRRPPTRYLESSYSHPRVPAEQSQGLSAGEGFYANPQQDVEQHEDKTGEGKKIYVSQTDGEWDTEFSLPAEFLKPVIVAKTNKTMARRLFDEIAIAPGATFHWSNAVNELKRTGSAGRDPMVIGRVVDRATRRRLCFLVAWFMDTADI